MKITTLALFSFFLVFITALDASPVLGWRTITPADAATKGLRFSFNEYEDGRIYVLVYMDPKESKHEIDAVGFAKLMTASYLDEKKTHLIAEVGDKLEAGKDGKLIGSVMLNKKTLTNVKIWIEFGHGDGFIHLDIESFVKEWNKKTNKSE
ncbi:hypothetical protein OAI07_00380 [Akkermansiaceae bacterium]|nr:hypothetical protein [Akkermansiaceae bacterium]